MNKEFFNVSKIINTNRSSKPSIEKIESKVETNIKNKVKKIRKNLNSNDKKTIISFDEVSRAPVSFPQKFNWRLFAKIVNNPSINSEEKAVDHFKRYAHSQSKLAKLYFREIYKIPELFDEDSYVEHLQSFNLKLDKKTIEIEKLYSFFTKIGKNKYPLNDSYYRILYKIPKHFHYLDYCNRYSEINFDKENVNEIYEYFNSEKNTKHILDDEYGRLKYNIPNHFDVDFFRERYKLEFTDDFDVYEFYHNNSEYPLDLEYLKLKFNLSDDFDIGTFKKRYEETANMNDLDIYEYYDTKNKKLDKTYFKIFYDISYDFDDKTFMKRYPELEISNDFKEIYKFFKNSSADYPLDTEYFQILYNIPEYFDCSKYRDIYNNAPKDEKSLLKFYFENQKKYPLDSNYFLNYFDISDNYFDWKFYRKNIIKDGSFSMFETFKHFTENKNNDNYYIDTLKLNSDFDYLEYYEEIKEKFLLDDRILNIDKFFIFQFIGYVITLEDIYNIYLKNSYKSEYSQQFIENYDYLENFNKIKNEKDKRHYFKLKLFVLDYINKYNFDKIELDKNLIEYEIDHKINLDIKNFNDKYSKYLNQNIEFEDFTQINVNYFIKNRSNIEKKMYLSAFVFLIDENIKYDLDKFNFYDNKFFIIGQNYEILLKSPAYFEKLGYKTEKINELIKEDKIIADGENLDFLDKIKPIIKQLLMFEIEIFNNEKLVYYIIETIIKSVSDDYRNFVKSNNDIDLKIKQNDCEIPLFKLCFEKIDDYDKIYKSVTDNILLFEIYCEKKLLDFKPQLTMIEKFLTKKNEIVILILDKSEFNYQLLDYYIKNYFNNYHLTLLTNKNNFNFIKKYRFIGYFNLINLNHFDNNIDSLNELMYNTSFWNLFLSENVLFCTNKIIIENLSSLNLTNDKFLAFITDTKLDKILKLQCIFVNKNYIFSILEKFNEKKLITFFKTNLLKFKKENNLTNIEFQLILEKNFEYLDLGINNIIKILE